MLNKNIFIKSRRAEIGETLTWFVAFLLIFFIMVLFTLSCMAIAAGKGFTSSNKDYTAQPVSGDIQTTENLIILLNTKTNTSILRELLISWSKETDKDKRLKLENSIKSFMNDYLQKRNVTFPCYDFTASLLGSNNLIYISNIASESTSTPLGPVPVYRPSNLYVKTPFYLSNGQQYILMKFYQGVCR